MHLPARNEVAVAFSSHDEARRVFGTGQQTGLEQGLARMAAWAKKVGIQSSRPFEGVEVNRNMPPSWERLLSQHAGKTS